MKFFAIVIAMISFMANATVQAQVVQQPAWRIGDSVSYSVTDPRTDLERTRVTNEVIGVSNDEIIIISRFPQTSVKLIETPGMNTIVQISEDGNAYHRFSGNSGHYKYPMAKGTKWPVKNSYVTRSGFEVSESLNATVDGWEQVTVPAGTFVAIKVTWEGFFQSKALAGSESGTGRREITRWLVPFSDGRLILVQEDYRETLWRNVVIGDNRQVAKATAITFADKP